MVGRLANGAYTDSIMRGYSFVLLGGIYVLVLLRDIGDVLIPSVVLMAFSAVVMTLFNRSDFAIMGCCMPLLAKTISVPLLLSIAMLIYLLKYRRNIICNYCSFLIFVLLVLEFTHIIIPPFSFESYFGHIITYTYLALMITDIHIINNVVIIKMQKTYVIFYLFIMSAIISQYILYYGSVLTMLSENIRVGDIRLITSTMESKYLAHNADFISLYSAMAIVACIFIMVQKKSKPCLWMACAILSILFGLSTMSKSFLILLAIILLSVIVIMIKNKCVTYSHKIFLGIIILIMTLVLCEIPEINVLLSNILLRIQNGIDNGSLTSRRYELFFLYLDFFLSNPDYWFGGIGLQMMQEKTGIWNVIHNGMQEVLVCEGILGVVIVSLLFIALFIYAKKIRNGSGSIYNLLMVVIFFIFIQSDSLIRLHTVYLNLIMVFYSMCFSNNMNNYYYKRRGFNVQ